MSDLTKATEASNVSTSEENFTLIKLPKETPQTKNYERERSYQLRALGRKTLTYQKRQMFVNVCCISLCPFLMVAAAGLLSHVILSLLRNSLPPVEEIVTCSSYNASNYQGFPILSDELPTLPSNLIPNAQLSSPVKQANFFTFSRGDSFSKSSGNSFLDPNLQTCTFWFEHNYPYRAPYELDPQVTDQRLRLSTTFKPDPIGGWLGQEQIKEPAWLGRFQTYPWYVVKDELGTNSGRKPELPSMSFNETLPEKMLLNQTSGTGIMRSFPVNYFIQFGNIMGTTKNAEMLGLPFIDKLSDRDVNEYIAEQVQTVLQGLSTMNNSVLHETNPDDESTIRYFVEVSQQVSQVPWGALIFSKLAPETKQWNYTLQIGMDARISKAAAFPSRGLRNVATQSFLGTAFLQSIPKTSADRISHGFRVMPQLVKNELDFPVGSFVGRILYPFGISFLLPVFVIMLVKEKEDRILIMMKMNGLKSWAYYSTCYIHFYLLHIITSIIFCVSGVAFGMELFTRTEPSVYILLLFIWGHVQIALAFFLSSFLSKVQFSLIFSFLLVLCGVLCNLALEMIFDGPSPIWHFIWPPFAFYHCLTLLNIVAVDLNAAAYTMAQLKFPNEVMIGIIFMIAEIFVLFALTGYINSVLPGEYGTKKPWHFIFTEMFSKSRESRELPVSMENTEIKEFPDEDDDVKMEKRRVLLNEHLTDSPLIMKSLSKRYGKDHLAVKDITLAIESDKIFGLLGPNGAGKTTLISILTGLYSPSSGQALVDGYDINTQMREIYMSIGICPQHNILWDDLTVGEHLLFFARLKGIPHELEYEAMREALTHVSLQLFENRLAKGLSGGEKRRLSIAIALVGNPKVVFLDEPTTGLDPEVRRLIWDIILDSKHGRTIILTTHSMEEADVLCNNIGIMVKGQLRCLGTSLHLKQTYGNGFQLGFSATPENMDQASDFIESIIPSKWTKQQYSGTALYRFSSGPGVVPSIFEKMESGRAEVGILDWGLSQTSLEEVFLEIVQEEDI